MAILKSLKLTSFHLKILKYNFFQLLMPKIQELNNIKYIEIVKKAFCFFFNIYLRLLKNKFFFFINKSNNWFLIKIHSYYWHIYRMCYYVDCCIDRGICIHTHTHTYVYIRFSIVLIKRVLTVYCYYLEEESIYIYILHY